jgi:predicted transposase YdaD
MRRDSIFYKIFSLNPALIFELLPTAPANANDYQFDSVAVKEPKFEIDGVFIPPKPMVQELFISARYSFRKTNNCMKGYLPNRIYIFIATANDIAIGKL